MKKLIYLIMAIAVLGLIVSGCLPVVPPSEQGDLNTLTKNSEPAEVWVDDGFTDSTPGWSVTHFATIQEGVAAVADYGTVYVLAGTYNEHIINQFVPYNKSFNLIGDGSSVVTWTAPSGQYPLQLDQQSDVSYEISGFKFVGDGANCIKFAGGGFDDLDVHDNVFENINATGLEFGLFMCRIVASRTDGVSSVRVHDNVFNTEKGICMSNTLSFDIYNNDFNVNVEGIYSAAGCCCAGWTIGDHRIYQNTFDGLSGDAIILDYWNNGFTYLVSAINHNNFESIDGYAVNVTTADRLTENATCNWWGSSDGPGEVGPGTGNSVSASVDYCPWLVGTYPGGECSGGAPVIEIGPITISPELIALGTETNLEADFTDPTECLHTAIIDWGDEIGETEEGEVDMTNGTGTVTGSYTYPNTGVFTVTLTITNDCNLSGEAVYQYAVVYDPLDGFVTGGGWIDSPSGAYIPDVSLTGPANFGFVSKYKKGQSTPTGNTEFQFKAGDLNFHSDSYDWLVIAGHKAKYKGIGTINGAGEYGFMLSAIDEKLTSSTDVDLFRIKIWDKATENVIYDNQISEDDNADPTTAIGGGQIVIHKGK